eukprot:TRINITY_DN23838_c0_g1_i1.p1 TRINITY_DN23838_c0_g1~~TRINITY_DN23838_c0_g1_i1.p1  ORF type:complete len:288 (+),score=49.21 TRINITY_DN23838_c0_g1_i1:92-865(+)
MECLCGARTVASSARALLRERRRLLAERSSAKTREAPLKEEPRVDSGGEEVQTVQGSKANIAFEPGLAQQALHIVMSHATAVRAAAGPTIEDIKCGKQEPLAGWANTASASSGLPRSQPMYSPQTAKALRCVSRGPEGDESTRAFAAAMKNRRAHLVDRLCGAAKTGRLTLMARAVSLGASPNARDSYGFTPLHYAARESRSEACELLLKLRADPGIVAPSGLTPLDVALQAAKAPVGPAADVVTMLLAAAKPRKKL